SEVRVLFEALVNVAQFNDGGFLLRHEFSPAMGTKQRKLRLPSSATGGISTAHRSIARGHRGRNGQPSGLPASVGAMPLIWCRRVPGTVLPGMDSSRPFV